MKISETELIPDEEDLKEIFALFSSPAEDERLQIYDPESRHYFRKVNLLEEYELVEPKQEYALDAWRAVLYFLYSKGFALIKDHIVISLSFSKSLFD